MYIVDGHPVDEATFLADEEAFEHGHRSYIRPKYDAQGRFLGFAVHVSGEPIGKVYSQYKHAALLLDQVRALHEFMAKLDAEEEQVYVRAA